MENAYAFLSKIPDQTGYQVISIDGAVMKSSGDLANKDTFAAIVYRMLQVAQGSPLTSTNESFQYMTVNFDNYFYSISISGKLIFVVKRNARPTNINANANASPTKNQVDA